MQSEVDFKFRNVIVEPDMINDSESRSHAAPSPGKIRLLKRLREMADAEISRQEAPGRRSARDDDDRKLLDELALWQADYVRLLTGKDGDSSDREFYRGSGDTNQASRILMKRTTASGSTYRHHAPLELSRTMIKNQASESSPPPSENPKLLQPSNRPEPESQWKSYERHVANRFLSWLERQHGRSRDKLNIEDLERAFEGLERDPGPDA